MYLIKVLVVLLFSLNSYSYFFLNGQPSSPQKNLTEDEKRDLGAMMTLYVEEIEEDASPVLLRVAEYQEELLEIKPNRYSLTYDDKVFCSLGNKLLKAYSVTIRQLGEKEKLEKDIEEGKYIKGGLYKARKRIKLLERLVVYDLVALEFYQGMRDYFCNDFVRR